MYDILTVGTATRDIFIESTDLKRVNDPEHLKKLGFISGEAQCFPRGAKIQVGRPTVAVGGGAANAAVTFARQGFKTASLFVIADDALGKEVLADMKKEHIAALPVIDKKKGTAFSVVLLSPDGERTILNYRGASEDLKKSDIVGKAPKSRWVYIAPGNIPYSVIFDLARSLRAAGSKIAINPSRAYIERGTKGLAPLLKLMDVVILNREEAAQLSGVPYEDEAGLLTAFDTIVPGIAVLTEGTEGVLVADGKNVYRAGIFPQKNIADRTGAGDAFGSAFVATLASAKAPFGAALIKEAIRRASANATSVIEKVGAQEGILTADSLASKRFKKLAVREMSA